ncbi:MAG TPA: lytic transglycosylase domain-containing protein [Micromonosporaceae bacterium]|nr:lytic transglycosylase domain-containing protein [Micromonosporaceae bacterium]
MSRLWSRFGIRAVAVALLLVGVVGGYYLGQDREVQQQGVDDQLVAEADAAELAYLKQRHAAHTAAVAQRRLAELEAARKAAEAARAEAERVRKAEAEASRKKRAAAAAASATATATSAPKAYAGPIPASCSSYSGNRKIGCAILLQQGFGLDQMPCLDKLWTKESGWNHEASNPSSGAYGIPQALPGSKMGTVADDWRTNPATQIKWGLGYITDRYGTPCDAWAHSQATGWY